MSGREFVIGTRGSELALWQARHTQALLAARFPQDRFRLEIIKTQGDRIQDRALYKVEDKGFFTKEIEEALLDRRIDVAVHSLKDLPTESPEGLTIGAVPAREDAHDVWVARAGGGPLDLAAGARVGTASLRRQAQLRALRSDLVFEDLRGNVPTRLRRIEEGRLEAVVLARAGLARLGLLPQSAFELPFEMMLPAPGQGALGIQVRSDDPEVLDRVRELEDPAARMAVTAERTFLARLQGGCLVPVGAHAVPGPNGLRLQGMVADLSGQPLLRAERTGSPRSLEEAATLGRDLADELLARGAGPLLDRVREFLRRSQASSRSLRGRVILQTREEDDALSRILTEAGALVRHVPLTRTLPPADPTPLRQAAARLSDFPWVALTSVRAVEALVGAIVDVRGLAAESDVAGPRWACVGRSTAEALRARLGVEADVVPEEYHAAALAEAILARETPRRVLFPAAENAKPDLPERLRRAGVDVVQVCAYRTEALTPDPALLQPPDGRDAWDAVILASGAAVESMLHALESTKGEHARSWLERCGPAVLGRSAEAALQAAGIRPVFRAPRPDAEELAAAILAALGR